MAVLSDLQGLLEGLNAVTTELDVHEYLIDSDTHASIPGAHLDLPEQLFVLEVDDSVELALYIEPGVLTHLEGDEPGQSLHNGNLESFCIALEGVSHFIKVVWSAQLGRGISALELEIQAEVDKFLVAADLLQRQGMLRRDAGQALTRLLFEHYEIRDDVPRDEIERYHTASKVARNFCETLLGRYSGDASSRRIVRDARNFYRCGLTEMLRSL